jgi:quercetin dioxygenase-like cupin family protein
MRIPELLATLAVLPALLPGCRPSPAHAADPASARLVLTRQIPPLRGDRLQVQVVEVSYPPGGASEPHRHPCAVIGYVADGAFRSQVQGEADTVYRAGQSFYEAPNAVHLISANASPDRPVRFTATFICDSAGALVVPAARP